MWINPRYCKHNSLKITARFYFPIYFIVRTLFFFVSSFLLYFSVLSLFLIPLFLHYPPFPPFSFAFYYVALGYCHHCAAGTGPYTCRSCYNVPMSPGKHSGLLTMISESPRVRNCCHTKSQSVTVTARPPGRQVGSCTFHEFPLTSTCREIPESFSYFYTLPSRPNCVKYWAT